jgi:hypothetical protein
VAILINKSISHVLLPPLDTKVIETIGIKVKFRAGMGNFEISGSNNLFRHEKIASWS